MKKNDIIELEITAVSSDGNGVGHYGGIAVFVPRTAAGDVISCRIVKVRKNYCYGIIDKITVSSPRRAVSDECAVSGKCGGCVFRHMTYEAELSAKAKIVKDAFERIGKLDIPFEPIIGSDDISRYRNKAQYPLAYENGRAVCGFYAPRSHRVVPCADCMLQPEIFSEITADILEYINDRKIPVYNEETGKGAVRHIYLRRGHYSKEIMVCIVSAVRGKKLFTELADILLSKYSDIKSVVLNINPARTNVIMGEECITLGGNDSITDIMCGNRIKIAPLSFYQVNTAQAEKLYKIAAEYAGFKGNETVLDLYCGAGTIGLSAADKIHRLIGCEIIPEAVENARENALLNGLDNAEFICGDAGETAARLAAEKIRPDIIITDPPRKGCDKKTLDAIIEMSPEKVIMISCDPASAARDTAYLCQNGYRAVRARAADMFPRTNHVECVVLMSKT